MAHRLRDDHGGLKQRNTIVFLIIFMVFAAGTTLLFRLEMTKSAVLAAGEHAEDEIFYGGVAAYPDAAMFGWGIYLASMLLFGACSLWIVNTGTSMEKIFLWVAIPLGIIYMVMILPIAAPDERFHYQCSYKLSNVLLFRWDQMELGSASHFDYHQLAGHYNVASGYDRIMREFFQPVTDEGMKTIGLTSIDFPLMYLPQAIGIAMGRILGLNFLPLFYLGRLANLLFYVLIVYHAIRIMPRYQLLLCMLALLPMNIQQAASYSYDTYVNGFSFLLIAMICRSAWLPSRTAAHTRLSDGWKRDRWKGVKASMASGISEEGTISWSELINLGIAILLWAPAKPVYLPLLLLLLLIPKEKFGSQRRRILLCGLLMLLAFVITLAIRISDIPGAGAYESDAMNQGYTLSWIIQHPVDTLSMALNTMRTSYTEWLYGCMGRYLAGLSILLPRMYMSIYLVLLLLCSLRRSEDATEDRSPASLANMAFKINVWHRVIMLGAILMVFGLLSYTMLLSWTPMGSDVIEGIQGRYFIPVFILAFMLLDNTTLVIHRNPKKVILIGGLMMHVATIMSVIQYTMMM